MNPGDELLTDSPRKALRAASRAVVRAGKGYVVEHGPGIDPERPERGWYAKAKLTGGRAVRTLVTEDGYPNGVEALEALVPMVEQFVRERGRR